MYKFNNHLAVSEAGQIFVNGKLFAIQDDSYEVWDSDKGESLTWSELRAKAKVYFAANSLNIQVNGQGSAQITQLLAPKDKLKALIDSGLLKTGSGAKPKIDALISTKSVISEQCTTQSPKRTTQSRILDNANNNKARNGAANGQFKGYYIVNKIRFTSAESAAEAAGRNRKTIVNWCKNSLNNCSFESVDTKINLT